MCLLQLRSDACRRSAVDLIGFLIHYFIISVVVLLLLALFSWATHQFDEQSQNVPFMGLQLIFFVNEFMGL